MVLRILIDAMGGDNAPGAIVQGAVTAAGEFGTEVVLVGREEVIRQMVENDHILGRYTALSERLQMMAQLLPR